jgi:predicted secreted acid phosphatase
MKHEIVKQYKALMPAVQHAARIISEHTVDPVKPPSIVVDIDNTIIFDDGRNTINLQIKHLLDVAKSHCCKIHLVTAREKSTEVIKFTREELRRLCIPYDTLALAPKKSRDSMASVSAWKHSERAKHNTLLSIGDQWGDLLLLSSDRDIDILDAAHNAKEGPWLIVKPNDGVTQYGMKIMA